MGGIGWYGPLINLSGAPSHVGDYVQLLVFVHRSTPVQYKLAKGGMVIRTDIQVGDETRPFFSVSLWNKQLSSSLFAGDIILLQNVKVMKFGNMVEARTVLYSSLLPLVHPYHSLLSQDVDELMAGCRLVGTAKEKLRRVIQWAQRARSTLCNDLKGHLMPAIRNWKMHQEGTTRTCSLLSEVLHLDNPCDVTFHASVGEMFLPSAWNESEKERLFISRRLTDRTDNVVEDMICTGCQLCGSPSYSEYHYSKRLPFDFDTVSLCDYFLCSELLFFSLCTSSMTEQRAGPVYCTRSSNRLHTLGLIYRPFMLYVWDDSDYIPLLVRNKAAELLFGNIKAEKVYQSYKGQKNNPSCGNLCKAAANVKENKSVKKDASRIGMTGGKHDVESPNFLLIWLILLMMLLIQEKNSPLKFEALVNPSFEMEDGRFEMTCVSMPYFKNHELSEA